jgi:hypothetical protein
VISNAPRAEPSAISPRPGTARRLADALTPGVRTAVVVVAGSVVGTTVGATELVGATVGVDDWTVVAGAGGTEPVEPPPVRRTVPPLELTGVAIWVVLVAVVVVVGGAVIETTVAAAACACALRPAGSAA